MNLFFKLFIFCATASTIAAQIPLPPVIVRPAVTNYAVVRTVMGTNVSAPSNEVSWTNAPIKLTWIAPADSVSLFTYEGVHYELMVGRASGKECVVWNAGTNTFASWPPPPPPTIVMLCLHLETSRDLTTWTPTNLILLTLTNHAGPEFFRLPKNALTLDHQLSTTN